MTPEGLVEIILTKRLPIYLTQLSLYRVMKKPIARTWLRDLEN
jgi:hypothetical protein